MDPPTPDHLPLTLASTLARSRLEAAASLPDGDPDAFIALTKDCIDAHAQATKAMIETLGQRVSAGENVDWKCEYDVLKDGLFNYCQSLVGEAEMNLAPEELDRPAKSSVDLTRHLLGKSSKTSLNSLKISPTQANHSPTLPSPSGDLNPSPSLSMPASNASGESYVLVSSRQRLRLFAVSSDDWIVYPSDSVCLADFEVMLPEGMSLVDESIHLSVVMGILNKLYSMAKLMQIILLSYGTEIDNSHLGLWHWNHQYEENVKSTDLKILITIAENLFYALYARVVIELANIELCGTFQSASRSLPSHRPFLLPEADHLYRIVIAFKDVLDTPNICANFHKDVALHFQQDYISQVVDKAKDLEYPLQDATRYRAYVARIVTDRNGAFCKKWLSLIPFFNVIPDRVMAMLSEHYLTVAPVVVVPDDIPFDQLPFINPDQIADELRDAETKKDHYAATLAKLEGTTIGDERLKDPKSRIYYLAKQRKCVCRGLCRCASECTRLVVNCCPCAERQIRILKMKRDLHSTCPGLNFVTTAGTMARMYFHGLASLRRGVTDHQISAELQRAFESMDALITNEREKKNPRRQNSKGSV
ncbi:unnamed protein product [Penicillium olsonii]|nr:unnamed protein product [Penicillium olsonii]